MSQSNSNIQASSNEETETEEKVLNHVPATSALDTMSVDLQAVLAALSSAVAMNNNNNSTVDNAPDTDFADDDDAESYHGYDSAEEPDEDDPANYGGLDPNQYDRTDSFIADSDEEEVDEDYEEEEEDKTDSEDETEDKADDADEADEANEAGEEEEVTLVIEIEIPEAVRTGGGESTDAAARASEDANGNANQ